MEWILFDVENFYLRYSLMKSGGFLKYEKRTTIIFKTCRASDYSLIHMGSSMNRSKDIFRAVMKFGMQEILAMRIL